MYPEGWKESGWWSFLQILSLPNPSSDWQIRGYFTRGKAGRGGSWAWELGSCGISGFKCLLLVLVSGTQEGHFLIPALWRQCAFPEIQFLPPFLPELAVRPGRQTLHLRGPQFPLRNEDIGSMSQRLLQSLMALTWRLADHRLSTRWTQAPGLLVFGLSAKNSFYIFK